MISFQSIDRSDEDDQILDLAAEIWSTARSSRQPTAGDKNLNADTIIYATWQDLASCYPGQEFVIVATNIWHLSQFTNVVLWQNLSI